MKLKTLLLIFILYAPFANAVNLICEANSRTHYISYYGMDCSDGCERTSDESFSIVFDPNNNKIIEVTNLSTYRGNEVYDEEITPSTVYFSLPGMGNGSRIDISIERTLGGFYAYSYNSKDEALGGFDGKCRVGRKLF